MFRGRYAHTIDKKGRVSIPMELRQALLERSTKPPMITNEKSYLAIYTREDWDTKEEELSNAPQLSPAVQAYQRFVISGALECPIDSQGRILIPGPLREHAMLERDVTVAGVGPRIEIWNKGLFDRELQRTAADFDTISQQVAVASQLAETER